MTREYHCPRCGTADPKHHGDHTIELVSEKPAHSNNSIESHQWTSICVKKRTYARLLELRRHLPYSKARGFNGVILRLIEKAEKVNK